VNLTEYMDFARTRFTKLMAAHEFEKLNSFLMHTTPLVLSSEDETVRKAIFDNFFSKVGAGYRTQYQCYDFECVDYDLHLFSHDMPMVRGPMPSAADLLAGNYFIVMGAAQLFGRFNPTPLHCMISKHSDLPALNLSIGGAGPEAFLNREHAIAAANRSRFVILQVLSGRSIGCEEYPGLRLTAPASKPNEPKRDRLEVLDEIWHRDRSEAIRLVKKWSENYVRTYLELIRRIERPVVIVWMSKRSPEDWTPEILEERPIWGAFPHLVSRAMVATIAGRSAYYVEGLKDTGLPHGVISRVTGKPCPFFNEDGTIAWKNSYYASADSHNALFGQMAPVVGSLLESRAPTSGQNTAGPKMANNFTFCFVIGRARSGTTVFRNMLGTHPLIVNVGEIFNEDIPHSYWHFLKSLLQHDDSASLPSQSIKNFFKYLDSQKSRGRPMVVMDIKYNQSHLLSAPYHDINALPIIFDMLRQHQFTVIDIHRHNILNLTLSNLVAVETGIYHRAASSDRPEQTAKVRIDIDRLLKGMESASLSYRRVEQHFAGYSRYLKIAYEDMFDRADGGLFSATITSRLSAFLGVDDLFDRRPGLHKLLSDDVFVHIENADAVRDAVDRQGIRRMD
jgi:hypothetical protein